MAIDVAVDEVTWLQRHFRCRTCHYGHLRFPCRRLSAQANFRLSHCRYLWYGAFMARWAVEVFALQTIGARSSQDSSYRFSVCGVIIALEVCWTCLRVLMKPLAGYPAVSRLDAVLSACLVVLLIVLIEVKVRSALTAGEVSDMWLC